MKMSRKIAGLLSFCMFVAVTGCSRGAEDLGRRPDALSSSSDTADKTISEKLTKEDITLTVWESVDGPDKWIKTAADEFNKLYPNITVEFHNVEIVDAPTELMNEQSKEPAPDLFGAAHDKIGELVENGLVLPTDNPDYVVSNTIYQASRSLIYDGVMYGYPTSCETYALFYNKALIKESDIPKTWNDMLKWCGNYKSQYMDKYGLVFHADILYYVATFMSDGENAFYIDENSTGLDGEYALNGAKLFSRFAKLLPENASSFDYDDYDDVFLNGDAAILINGPWFMTKAEAARIDYGVVPLPSFTEGGNPSTSYMGTRCMMVSSRTEHPKEAAAFARFLISKDMQKLRHEITLTLPAVNIEVDEKVDGFIEQLEYSQPMSNAPQVKLYWSCGTEFCKNVLAGKDPEAELEHFRAALRGDISADESSTQE